MITINLYDYKRIVRDVGIQKRLGLVLSASIITFVVCSMIWVFQIGAIWRVEKEVQEVQKKVKEATPDYQAVQYLKKQQTKYKSIITGIDKLRSDQTRTTEFLEDIGEAVPEGVWLTSIKQLGLADIKARSVPFLFISYEKGAPPPPKKGSKDKFVELKGVGMNDQTLVHFLEQLRAIPYIDAVVLDKSRRQWMGNQPVQKFDIYCHFLKTKA